MNKTKVPDIPKSKPTRREQVRAAKKRRAFTWNAIVLGSLGLFGLAIAAFFVAGMRPGPLPGEQVIADEGSGVADTTLVLTFNHYPPSSGTHYAELLPWGFLTNTTPITETYLSNLAAGGVVYLYECETECAALQQQLTDLAKKVPPEQTTGVRKIVVAQYAGDLDTPIVALAWGHQLNVQQYDEGLLTQWYRRFLNQGPKR